MQDWYLILTFLLALMGSALAIQRGGKPMRLPGAVLLFASATASIAVFGVQRGIPMALAIVGVATVGALLMRATNPQLVLPLTGAFGAAALGCAAILAIAK